MSRSVDWADLLTDAAEVAAKYAPQPAGIVISIATGIARALVAAGCDVCGAPDAVDLQPADLPDAAGKMRDARADALTRTSGR